MLLPGDRYKTKIINVLLPGAETRKNTVIKERRTRRTL